MICCVVLLLVRLCRAVLLVDKLCRAVLLVDRLLLVDKLCSGGFITTEVTGADDDRVDVTTVDNNNDDDEEICVAIRVKISGSEKRV